MIAHDGRQCTSSAYLFNDLGQPLAAGFGVFDSTHLLTGIDHETIRDTDPHLIFDERAVREVLDSVIRIYLAASGRLSGFLKGLVVSIVLVGGAIAATGGGAFRRIGRRKSLIPTSIVFITFVPETKEAHSRRDRGLVAQEGLSNRPGQWAMDNRLAYTRLAASKRKLKTFLRTGIYT